MTHPFPQDYEGISAKLAKALRESVCDCQVPYSTLFNAAERDPRCKRCNELCAYDAAQQSQGKVEACICGVPSYNPCPIHSFPPPSPQQAPRIELCSDCPLVGYADTPRCSTCPRQQAPSEGRDDWSKTPAEVAAHLRLRAESARLTSDDFGCERFVQFTPEIAEHYASIIESFAATHPPVKDAEQARDAEFMAALSQGYAGSYCATERIESVGVAVKLFYTSNDTALAAHKAICEAIDAARSAQAAQGEGGRS